MIIDLNSFAYDVENEVFVDDFKDTKSLIFFKNFYELRDFISEKYAKICFIDKRKGWYYKYFLDVVNKHIDYEKNKEKGRLLKHLPV